MTGDEDQGAAVELPAPGDVCWQCVKGRHAICDDYDAERRSGSRCQCPVCHANRYATRQPVYDAGAMRYYDPGPSAEPVDHPPPG